MRRQLHILVVDDDIGVRDAMSDLLRSRGHTVDTAVDGVVAARSFLADPEISLVFSDLNMGGDEKDGNNLFLAIEPELAKRRARFILVAGANNEQALSDLKRRGAVIVKKPIQLNQFYEAMKSAEES
jgi:DNA-binding NtrC family response regulator